MFDPRAEQVTRAPNDTVYGITFGEEQLSEIGPVLTGDAGDERAFRFRHGRSMIQCRSVDKPEPWRTGFCTSSSKAGPPRRVPPRDADSTTVHESAIIALAVR